MTLRGEQQGASSSEGLSSGDLKMAEHVRLEKSEAGIALLMDLLAVADYFEYALLRPKLAPPLARWSRGSAHCSSKLRAPLL